MIELLVVIAVIAILAAVLFPLFAQARAKARQAICLSNMKQIGMGTSMYTQDYDEILPGNDITGKDPGYNLPNGFMTSFMAGMPETYRNWGRDLQPYIRNTQVYLCPDSVPRSSIEGGLAPYNEISNPGINTSYLLNGVVQTQPMAAIQMPADLILMHELKTYTRTCQARPIYAPATRTATQLNYFLYDVCHHGGANLLFIDNHAKWQRKSQIRFAQFGAPPELNPGKPTNFLEDDLGAGSQNSLTFNIAL